MPCACEQPPRDYLAGARSGNSIRAELLCLLIGKQSPPDQYFRYDCYIGFKLPIFTNARILGKSAIKTDAQPAWSTFAAITFWEDAQSHRFQDDLGTMAILK